MKKLIYSELLNMIGQEVFVVDLMEPATERVQEPQYCIVTKNDMICEECGNKYFTISLENNDYQFSYDRTGNCIDGPFYAYSLHGSKNNLSSINLLKEQKIFDKLMEMYLKETTNDEQMFCGCRKEDCTDWHTEKCKDCLIDYIITNQI